jgi:hypothetical protein
MKVKLQSKLQYVNLKKRLDTKPPRFCEYPLLLSAIQVINPISKNGRYA